MGLSNDAILLKSNINSFFFYKIYPGVKYIHKEMGSLKFETTT